MQPFSSDPLKYDYFVHHIAFRSVFSGVLSEYKTGAIQGVIAKSWDASEDKTKWRFTIRKNLKFENGDAITPGVVAANWRRVAYLMHKASSESGLFEYLKNIETISPSEGGEGITFDLDSVTLSFYKPIPNLLSKISFGLYSVAHPSQFNSKTGEWYDERKAIASGPYKITKWDELAFNLELRDDFPKELLLERPIKYINIDLQYDLKNISDADFVIGGSSALALDRSEFSFFGPVESNIRYVKCSRWNVVGSPCYDLENRKKMRAAFYKEVAEIGYEFERSFLPIAIRGVTSSKIEALRHFEVQGKNKISLRKSEPVLKSIENQGIISASEAFYKGLGNISKECGIDLDFVTQNQPDISSSTVDLELRITGVLIEDPHDDIRFMFLSKFGIQLPDSTGEIVRILKSNKNFEPQAINQLLWDQAIIWPLGHFSYGYWIRKDFPVNISNLNLTLPPIDFQWVEWVD